MMKYNKTVNFLFLGLIFFFFVNFVAQKTDTTKKYGELGNSNAFVKHPAVTTTTAGVFEPQDNIYGQSNVAKENTNQNDLSVFFTSQAKGQRRQDAIANLVATVGNRRYIPYTYLRESDVTWQKRVWRRIDLREKINQPIMLPKVPTRTRASLLDIIKLGIEAQQIFLFEDDEFTKQYTDLSDTGKYAKIFKSVKVVEKLDQDGNPTGQYDTIKDNYQSDQFFMLDLKEDWFFDKQRSVLDVRILGISLSRMEENALGVFPKEMGWVYYPQCRPWFAKFELFNTKNDAERRTYEDFFWKRQFTSYITRESNVFDRRIDEYTKGLDALIEADRIKGDVYRWEHDLWHF